MAIPLPHKLRNENSRSYCPSIGTSPVAGYMRIPFRGTITKAGVVAQGIITGADCVCAMSVNNVANTNGNVTLPVASAAAGQIATIIPPTNIYVNEDDIVSFLASGASGTAIGAEFFIVMKDTQ
jgi:hypothetical protein